MILSYAILNIVYIVYLTLLYKNGHSRASGRGGGLNFLGFYVLAMVHGHCFKDPPQ